MAYTVLIPEDVAQEGKSYLRDRGYEIRMGSGATPDALTADLASCHAVLARTEGYPARVLEAAPLLRVIGRHGVGVDSIDVPRATELGIFVTNTPEALSATVAEHTLGLMICVARNFGRCERALRGGDWDIRSRVMGVDLEGKTLGIVGMGRIGRMVARKASLGLSMRVVGYDPFVDASALEDVPLVQDLREVFAESDFVTLHMPATADTRGMVGAELLGVMKPSSYLINAARGAVVVTEDLVAALRDERIAGAALDVYEDEPLAADSPLLELENVVLTPHIASATKECMVRMAVHAAMGIHDVLSGVRPQWPVNDLQPRG